MTDTTGIGEGVVDDAPGPGSNTYVASQLTVHLQDLRDLLLDSIAGSRSSEHRGELTLHVDSDTLIGALQTCRDDDLVMCEMLSDISAVHWPGGTVQKNEQETTGWPTFTKEAEGRIEIDYIVRSIRHNHWFRIRVDVPDTEDATLPSATSLYSSANFMEREAYDMIGVHFEGHPNLTRILMPDDWDGFPHRKDYPLGGVEVMYKGETVPPPDERDY